MKRRKDLELEYRRKFEPWLTAWQVGKGYYFLANVFHPAFIKHLQMWPGYKLIMLWRWFKQPVTLWWRE
jgi:hypothetical protein